MRDGQADSFSTHRLKAVLLFGVLAQGLLLYVAHAPERTLRGDEAHYQQQALRLLAGESLPAFFLFPPLYPRLIAIVYGVFGPGRLAVELFQSGLLLASALLLRRLLLRGGATPGAADAALALFLLDPQTAAFAQYLWPEIPHLFLVLAGLALLLAGPPTARRILAAGVAFGLAILTKSLLTGFLPILVGTAAMRGIGRSGRLRLGALLAAGVLATLLPVIVANGLRHGYWGVANSSAFNLWIGLNDPASRSDYDSVPLREGQAYLASSSDENERTQILWNRIREHVQREGVLRVVAGQFRKQYMRLFDGESFFTDQLPGGRWDRESPATRRSLFLRLWAYSAYALLLVSASFGVALYAWRSRLREAAIPTLFLVYNLGLFLFLHVKTRYRVAFVPALLFFAAWSMEYGFAAFEGRRSGAPIASPGRAFWTGALLAGLALSLAFCR